MASLSIIASRNCDDTLYDRLYRASIVVGLTIIMSGCTLSNAIDEEQQSSFSSSLVRRADEQSEIGKREHPIVLAKYGGEYRNKNAENLVAIIVGRLVAASEDKQQIYKITLLNSPRVNAFALPGGYLYVTRGLLALANDSAELAGVIAHEMAHVSSNHSILRNQKQASVDVGSEVVNEILDNKVAGRVALAANQLRLAEFSRHQELQADAIGIRTLGTAGFDGFAAARFLETMQAYQNLQSAGSGQFSDTAFLSSHPSTPKRVELAKRHARYFGGPGSGATERARYLKGIDGLLYGDSAEEGFVRGNRFSHRGLGITFEAPLGSKIENQATAVVVTAPNDLATRFDAAVIPKGQSLEGYLKSGWVKGLDEDSIVVTQLNGLPAAEAKAVGGNWQFVIRVIQIDRQVYRFITAGTLNNNAIDAASLAIAKTFRKLNASETAALESLKIRIVTVSTTDTLATLSAQMNGTVNPLRTFQVINGLSSGELPKAGDQVKIVSDH